MNTTRCRLAKAIWVDARRVPLIINGERGISAETVLLFARFFGNSAGFWMGLPSQYDLDTTEDNLAERLSSVVAYSAAGSEGSGVEESSLRVTET